MKIVRAATITLAIVCVFLAISLILTKADGDSTVKARENTIIGLNADLAERNDEISMLNSIVLNQTLEIDNLTNQKMQLQTWLDDNTTAFTTQIENLQADVNNTNAQLDNATTQISTLQNQALTDQSTIGNMHGQIDVLNVEKTGFQGQITELKSQNETSQATIADLRGNLAATSNRVVSLESNNSVLQGEIGGLEAIINLEVDNLHTLVFHVCEKNWVHPNVTSVYNQILALNNNSYSILMLPEYKEHGNWTQELAWMTKNFGGSQGIPVMLDVFASSKDNAPITRLTIENVVAARSACNVKYVRFMEVVSWHEEHNQTFPLEYIQSMLEFCRTNGLKVFWTEWKPEAFATIQNCTRGYEDIVTISFSTNSGFLKPGAGCLQIHECFQHWGASVQSWYWDSYTNQTEWEMPANLLVEHALAAKNIGAEIIQFEPYYYFFENGRANDKLKLLMEMLA